MILDGQINHRAENRHTEKQADAEKKKIDGVDAPGHSRGLLWEKRKIETHKRVTRSSIVQGRPASGRLRCALIEIERELTVTVSRP